MRVVLINAPYLDIYGSINVGRNHGFSLGLGYIASVLRYAGNEVYLLDPEPLQMDHKDIKNYLMEKDPQLVGISCATPNFKGACQIAQLIKREMGITVVLGGVHASGVPIEIMENYPEFDIVAVGEGERTMVELCQALDMPNPNLERILGIVYRDNGTVKRTLPRPLIEDVDSIPFPARDLVDLSKYRSQVHLDRGKRFATMLTSRGCPARCTFCATKLTMGRGFRSHSPEYVISEIEHLITAYGIEHFVFVDDTFTINKKRVEKICRMIIERDYNIIWYCFARVNTVSKDLLLLMKEAGCFSLLYGVESANDVILRNIKKGANADQARQALKISNELGFKTLAAFLIGSPGDTKETVEENIKFAIELNPVIASFNRITPFPGTELYETHYKPKYGNVTVWDDFFPKGINPILVSENLTKSDLQRLTVKAYIRFYLRPKQIIRILFNLGSFSEFMAYVRGAFGLFRRIWEWKRA